MRSFRSIALILAWLLCLAATAYFCARFLRGADTALYNFFVRPPQAKVELLFPGEKLPMRRVLLPHHSPVYPTVYSVLWENSTNSDTTDDSLLLRELSTILHCLASQRHVQIIGISATPTWADAADPTARKMFHHSLEGIHHLRMGLQVESSAHSPLSRKISSLSPSLRKILRAIPPACQQPIPTLLFAISPARRKIPSTLPQTTYAMSCSHTNMRGNGDSPCPC